METLRIQARDATLGRKCFEKESLWSRDEDLAESAFRRVPPSQ